jgi:DeoR/GlpR family transcriptional regulator of sugar metabolism
MLKEERRQLILEILNKEQKVIASDLINRFMVSEDTIRRDLKELDNQGLIRRVHSGALKIGPPVTDFAQREDLLNDAKIAIAKKALPLIKNNQVIIIDGGTTNLRLVNQLPKTLSATVITNSPPIATALKPYENIEIIMVGGTLYKQSMVNLGPDTIEALSLMRADLYIMGIYNIDSQIGISVPTLNEAFVKRKMASISTEIIGLVTADKIGTASNQIVTPASVLTYLVTEDTVNHNVVKAYQKQHIMVIV